jgi:hypothetical protein
MKLITPVGRVRRSRLVFLLLLVLLIGTLILGACGGGTGACVGSGGDVLLSPVCKPDWSRAECQEWDAEGINGANWDYFGGDSCEGLGYTDRCSDGSYRYPGDC